jgi:hypothetical protein
MIDEEIRQALDVDPSPEFLARVRRRIASEPVCSEWRWPWTLAVAGAMAAVMLTALIVSKRPDAPSSTAAPVTKPFSAANNDAALRPSSAEQRAPALEPAISEVKRRNRSRGAIDRRLRLSLGTAGWEVLVDPREAAALRAFALRVRDGRTDLTAILRTTPTVEQEPLLDLNIDPIVVEPLRADAGKKE